MPQLVPLQIDDHTLIYLEAVAAPQMVPPSPSGDTTRGDLGRGPKGGLTDTARQAIASFAALETTLKTYTQGVLDAFKDLGSANVDQVKLEFGVNLAGEAGIPYITKGTAECSLKITVECSFPPHRMTN